MYESLWVATDAKWKDEDGSHVGGNASVAVLANTLGWNIPPGKIRLSVNSNVHEWGSPSQIELSVEQAQEVITFLQQAIQEVNDAP